MKYNPKDKAFEIVETGYDKLAERYAKEREQFENWNELQKFCLKLPSNAKVLDVGCGTGIPISRHLIQSGFEVVGIDLSKKMVSVARWNLPGSVFLQMNMVEIDFPPQSFDGLISCYSIFHVPREEHADLFRSFHTILKTHGVMLVSVGSCEWQEVADYFGVKMFWSHYNPITTESLIVDAGFDIEFGKSIESGGEVHHWVLARRC